MKPTFFPANAKKRFPQTDYSFQSGIGEWRGYSSHDDDERPELRHFFRLSRESMRVCASERLKEMAVFGVVVLVAAWPVIYMIVTIVEVLLRTPPGN